MAPADVAIASDKSAGLMFGNFPFSSSIPAFVLTPMIVPNVSNKSTKRNANTTIIKFTIDVYKRQALPLLYKEAVFAPGKDFLHLLL